MVKRLEDALLEVQTFIEDSVQCTGSRDNPSVIRCFNCDEFMDDAVWPRHGNPNCDTMLMLAKIENALRGGCSTVEGFEPPPAVACPCRCGGTLRSYGRNKNDNLTFLECDKCSCTYHAADPGKEVKL